MPQLFPTPGVYISDEKKGKLSQALTDQITYKYSLRKNQKSSFSIFGLHRRSFLALWVDLRDKTTPDGPHLFLNNINYFFFLIDIRKKQKERRLMTSDILIVAHGQ